MKRIVLGAVFFAGITASLFSQTRLHTGGGYFGETAVYPGFTAELEFERSLTSGISRITRGGTGFYSHPRNHNALFLDASRGYRRYLNSGIYLE